MLFRSISLSVSASIDMDNVESPLELYTNPVFVSYIVGSIGTLHAVLVYFIRKWSKEWNAKFENKVTELSD